MPELLSFDYGARAEAGGGPAARTLPAAAGRDRAVAPAGTRAHVGLRDQGHRRLDGRRDRGASALPGSQDRGRALARDRLRADRRGGAPSPRARPVGALVGAAFCPQEGKINPLVATEGVLSAALAAGARLHTNAEIRAIRREGDAYAVDTSRGPIRARRVVNAAGAFASRIGAMLGLDVPVFGAPLQMVVTEAVAPLVSGLVAHAGRHLTLKQAATATSSSAADGRPGSIPCTSIRARSSTAWRATSGWRSMWCRPCERPTSSEAGRR